MRFKVGDIVREAGMLGFWADTHTTGIVTEINAHSPHQYDPHEDGFVRVRWLFQRRGFIGVRYLEERLLLYSRK